MPSELSRRAVRLAFLTVILAMAPSIASAVSLRDLMELSKAGLSDEVLIALVEADDTEFNLDAPKILELREAGVSERVIVAMLRKRRQLEAPVAPAYTETLPTAPEPQVQVTVVQAPPVETEQRRVILVPWWPVAVRSPHPAAAPQPTGLRRGFGRFMNDGWVERPAPPRRTQ